LSKTILFPPINAICEKLTADFDHITTERKNSLNQLSKYLVQEYQQGLTPKAIVICTHNSRRSHMGQIWLSIAADYYGLPKIESFSGGTEATAFNPRAVHATKEIGLQVTSDNLDDANPTYQIKWNEDMPPYLCFSKRFDSSPNPKKAFAAIMVCTEADEACPIVPGVAFRLTLPFHDPKAYDDTPLEGEKYMERCLNIGQEFLFVMHQVKMSL